MYYSSSGNSEPESEPFKMAFIVEIPETYRRPVLSSRD